jgi:hypothetical protein
LTHSRRSINDAAPGQQFRQGKSQFILSSARGLGAYLKGKKDKKGKEGQKPQEFLPLFALLVLR